MVNQTLSEKKEKRTEERNRTAKEKFRVATVE